MSTSELMLDGTLCSQCGVYIGRTCGHPVKCEGCKQDDKDIPQEENGQVYGDHI